MSELVQATFDYSVLSPEQAQRTQEAEYRLIGRTQKAIIDNGKDLRAVKADIGHGHFLNWIHSIGISEKTAENWMNVAENFGEIRNGYEFENVALYLLSTSKVPESAREEAKERAEDGEKITEEVARQIRDAHKAREQAEAEKLTAQQQLFQIQADRQSEVEALNRQIRELQQEMHELVESPKEIQYETSPEVKEQLRELGEKVKTLTEQRNNLSKKAEELGKEAREAALKRNEEERERQVRQDWRKLTKDFQVAVVKLMSQLPTSMDMQVFEADDWERLSQAKELARRFIAECENLSRSPSMIIDAGWQVPYAVES